MKRSIGKITVLVCSVVVAFFVTIVLRLFIEEGIMLLLSILAMLTTWAAAFVGVTFFFTKEEKLQQLNEKREKVFVGVIKVLWALAVGFCLTLIVIGIHISLFLRVLLLGLIWFLTIGQILTELKKIRQK